VENDQVQFSRDANIYYISKITECRKLIFLSELENKQRNGNLK